MYSRESVFTRNEKAMYWQKNTLNKRDQKIRIDLNQKNIEERFIGNC